MRQLQHFLEMLGDVAQLQIAVHLAGAGQRAHHGAQPAAVDEYHVAEMQHDRAPVAQQMSDVSAQGFDLAAGHQACFTADDSDASHFAGLQFQPHVDLQSEPGQRATALSTTVLRSSPVMAGSKPLSSSARSTGTLSSLTSNVRVYRITPALT